MRNAFKKLDKILAKVRDSNKARKDFTTFRESLRKDSNNARVETLRKT